MRGNDEAGAAGARAPRILPVPGDLVLVKGVACERPGMFKDPRIGVCEPSLADGVWVIFQESKTSSRVMFVELSELEPNFAK